MGISISRNPDRAKTLGIVYCVLEGLTLGILVTIADLYAQGLALAAFLATCGVFVFALLLFRRFSARSYSSVTKFVFISLSSLGSGAVGSVPRIADYGKHESVYDLFLDSTGNKRNNGCLRHDSITYGFKSDRLNGYERS